MKTAREFAAAALLLDIDPARLAAALEQAANPPPANPTPPPLLTVRQAATALSICPESVKRLLRVGKLPGRRVGGVWRVEPSALATLEG